MNEKYIRKNKESYNIFRNSKNYGKFNNLKDAVFIRDILVENNWDLYSFDEIYSVNDKYMVVKVFGDKIHILEKSDTKPSDKRIKRLVKEHLRNPNNSKYGLNISKIFDTYIIKKQIAGDDYIFGYYDNLSDAQIIRNHLLENNWNVDSFSQIHYDEDTNSYNVVEVIDDKVYVLDSFKSDDIDITKVHDDFLNKIIKHKLKLIYCPYLDELTDIIPQLEEIFAIKVSDNFNQFDNLIFDLTPFQKKVYDEVDDSTVEDIEKALILFKSRNFTQKIIKNLDELIELGLIKKNKERYQRV